MTCSNAARNISGVTLPEGAVVSEETELFSSAAVLSIRFFSLPEDVKSELENEGRKRSRIHTKFSAELGVIPALVVKVDDVGKDAGSKCCSGNGKSVPRLCF